MIKVRYTYLINILMEENDMSNNGGVYGYTQTDA